MTSDVPETFLALQGVIARNLPGYRRREQQELLAQGVEMILGQDLSAYDEPLAMLAEAGTGTGKSLAALIPAILTSHSSPEPRRYVVATATNALLAQYSKKDLPWLEEVLGEAGIEFTWAPLKGLAQFACAAKLANNPKIAHLDDLLKELAPGENGEMVHSGDRDDITTPIDQRLEWPLVASTTDECPGRGKCSFAEQCFGFRHKDAAMEADIVVTNLAVLLTDTKIGREYAGDNPEAERVHPLLGPYDGLIVDEAHELQDAATNHLGFDIKQGGLLKWADQAASFLAVHEDADEQRGAVSSDMHENVREAVEALTQPLSDQIEHAESGTLDADFITYHADKFIALYTAMDALRRRVVSRKLADRCDEEKEKAIKERVMTSGRNFLANIKAVLLAEPSEIVRWAEMYGHERLSVGKRWAIKAAPIDVGSYLREELWSRTPSVLMSATLSAGTGQGRFDYITRTLGLGDRETTATLDVGSPFDYPSQALFFHPDASVPAPAGSTRTEWETWLAAATLSLVRAAGGGALLLYTSRRAMNAAHAALAPALRADGINSFVQGAQMSNKEIADRFREDEDSVLFGLRSFMTGVDFSGRTNRLVIVDKLPFPVPTDPIISARSAAIEHAGGNPFSQLVVPSMTLTLQQAFGRLIRSTDDWGTVAVMDSRLASKGYGRGIVKALPPARVTTSLDDVRAFYQQRQESLPAVA
ncbi:ATP-dependent DNA helicase [Streptomyces griseoaurantiacus]|uniref:ATP-dependent DNA helicase n=1 Tax=Streptomyces griseoaurantiacus TaxID=68213 RepID=UPI00369BDB40